MPKPKNAIPSIQLNVALPLDVHTQLSAYLYSDLEGRVPHGAYSRFLVELLRGHFAGASLDMAPFLDSAPGAFVLQGTPEAIFATRQLIKALL